MFDYPSSCPSIFATIEDLFTVLTDKKACEGKSCLMNIAIAYKENKIQLSTDENNQFVLKVNSRTSTLPFVSDKGFKILKVSTSFIKFESTDGIHIVWDGKLRLYVKVPASFHKKLAGLAGNFDGKTINEFITPSGDLSHTEVDFGNSWLLPSSKCPKLSTDLSLTPCEENHQNVIKAEKSCNIINRDIFMPCHSVLDPQAYYEDCKQDVCGCKKSKECFCGVLSAYAAECALQGKKLSGWREASQCGMLVLFKVLKILQNLINNNAKK